MKLVRRDEEVITLLSPGFTVAVILMVGFGLVALARMVFSTFPRVNRREERSFWCPFKSRNVIVEFQEDAWDDRPIHVERCSAFTPPTAVACDQRCLEIAELPATRAS